MKQLIAAIGNLLGSAGNAAGAGGCVLDYDRLVILDAEALAEGGIGKAYEQLKPSPGWYVDFPAEMVEALDSNLPGYSVTCAGVTDTIYSPALPDPEDGAWGRATPAFFALINSPLEGAAVRFYAINVRWFTRNSKSGSNEQANQHTFFLGHREISPNAKLCNLCARNSMLAMYREAQYR